MLEIRIGHFRDLILSLGLLVLLVLELAGELGQGQFDALSSGRTGTSVESHIICELHIADCGTHCGGCGEHTSELQDSLILQLEDGISSDGMALSRILQVLAVCIVQGSNLTLCVAILLHRVGHVVLLRWEDCRGGHAGREPSADIGSTKDVPGVESNLGLHSHYFVTGIQVSKG